MLAHAVCAAKPCGGSSFAMRDPSVLMIRQPPAYVPRPIAAAELMITHSGGRSKSGERCPDATSASAMIPIVFCASFVPCVKATKAPEKSWSRRKMRFTMPGARFRMIQRTLIISAAARNAPSTGASKDGISTLSFSPSHWTTPRPSAATADPTMPPMSAWLELDGSPMYQVMRFQVIAPTRPARTMSSVMTPWSTIPFAIVAATSKDTNAPRKFRNAALTTAVRGESARVDTEVAIALAVSWNPFVKSKNNATTTTPKSKASIACPRRVWRKSGCAARPRCSPSGLRPQSRPYRMGYGRSLRPFLRTSIAPWQRAPSRQTLLEVLDDDVPDDVGSGLAGVDRILERLEDVLPADHLDGIHMVLEEAGDRLPKKAVRLVFEGLHTYEVAFGVAQPAQLSESPGKVLDGLDEEPALLERLLHRTVDLVEREEVRRVLDEVDDVV